MSRPTRTPSPSLRGAGGAASSSSGRVLDVTDSLTPHPPAFKQPTSADPRDVRGWFRRIKLHLRDMEGDQAAQPPLLEQDENTVDAVPHREAIKVIGCRCNRHVCKSCGRNIGYKARYGIKDRIAEFQSEHNCQGDVQMWTLTLDRKRARYGGLPAATDSAGIEGDPQLAYDVCANERAVSECMRIIGRRYNASRYIKVLEFQQGGWPHWHILIWSPKRLHIPIEAMRSAWGRGYVSFTSRWVDRETGRRYAKPLPIEWAVNYITKYLTKPESQPPDWVMDRQHVRLIEPSRGSDGFGAIMRGRYENGVADVDAGDRAGRVRAVARSNREAITECRQSCRVLRERVTNSGVVVVDFICTLPISMRTLQRWIERVPSAEHKQIQRNMCAFYANGGIEKRFKRLIDSVTSSTTPSVGDVGAPAG